MAQGMVLSCLCLHGTTPRPCLLGTLPGTEEAKDSAKDEAIHVYREMWSSEKAPGSAPAPIVQGPIAAKPMHAIFTENAAELPQ